MIVVWNGGYDVANDDDVLVVLNRWMNVVSIVVDRCVRINESISNGMNERLNVSRAG